MSAQRIPPLKQLMGFEAAARLGNFSRAAEELCLSQSAISHQIQILEEQLGQPLFRRKGRGVELTIAGKVLLRSVQDSTQALRNGLWRISAYLDPGLVTLVCPAPLLQGWLQPRLPLLHDACPELCPLLSTAESAHYIDENDVDIVISNRPIQEQGLLEQPFLQDELITVCSAELALKLASIPQQQHHQHCQLICLEEQRNNDSTTEIFRVHLAHFRTYAIYDDARLLMDATLRGHGIACISRLLAEENLNNGKLAILANYPRLPGTTWWISRIGGESRSEVVEKMFDWLLLQGNQSA